MSIKAFSRQNFASKNFNVINATPVATYSLSSLAASYNEGDTITITITTGFLLDGTVLYWTTSGTSTGADFSDGVTSGSVTITNNIGTVTRTLLSDLSTEGTETFVFELRTVSTSGTIVATSSSANVLDTSTSPINYSILFPTTSKTSINLPSSSSLYNLTGDFTVECWVNPTALVAGDWGIFDCRVSGGTAAVWLVNISSTGKAGFYDGTLRAGTITIPINTWTHLAWVRNGSSLRIYVNGVVDYNNASYGTGAISPGTTAPKIGTKDNGIGGYDTQGYISNFRFVKGTAVYTAAFTPPVAQLSAITNTVVLTGKSGTLSDASSNALTLTNSGTLISGENPFGNYSMSFNSTSQYLSVPANTAFVFGTGDYTIEFWLYGVTNPGGASGYNLIFCSPQTNSYTLLTYNGAICLNFNGGTLLETAAGSITQNVWYHIAVARQSSVTTIYLNGVSKASIADTNNYSGSPSRTIGPSTGGTAGFYMSNVRIVKGTAVYTANFSPPTSPLTAITNTSLLICQYAELFDDSTNHFTITNNGTTPAITANPFDNYAWQFNPAAIVNQDISTAAAIVSSTTYSVEAFVYATGTVQGYIANQYSGGNANRTVFLFRESDGNLYFYHPNTGTISAGALSAYTWHHVAITRDSGGRTRIFLDGVLAATFTTAYTVQATPFSIGGNGDDSGSPFQGYITNVRVLNGDIPAAYQTSSTTTSTTIFTVPTTPLTAVTNTVLLTCQYAELFDASTNNYALTNRNTATAVATNLFAAPNNLKNYSGKFNGSQYLTVPANAAFAFGTGDFTVEMWVYPRALGVTTNGINYFIDNRATAVVGEWTFGTNTAGDLIFANGASGNFSLSASAVITLNNWQHVAVVRSGTTFTLYRNGVQVATTTSSQNFSTTTSILAISSNPTNAYYFNGYISNARIVKGTAVYTATFTPSATPLLPVSGTSLLTLQSNRIYDSGPNQFTITNNGSTTMSYLSPFST